MTSSVIHHIHDFQRACQTISQIFSDILRHSQIFSDILKGSLKCSKPHFSEPVPPCIDLEFHKG